MTGSRRESLFIVISFTFSIIHFYWYWDGIINGSHYRSADSWVLIVTHIGKSKWAPKFLVVQWPRCSAVKEPSISSWVHFLLLDVGSCTFAKWVWEYCFGLNDLRSKMHKSQIEVYNILAEGIHYILRPTCCEIRHFVTEIPVIWSAVIHMLYRRELFRSSYYVVQTPLLTLNWVCSKVLYEPNFCTVADTFKTERPRLLRWNYS